MNAQILIVDDDPDIRTVLRVALERAGFQVLLAATGNQALQMATRHRPDLVILDIGLPELDGLEICRRLQRTLDLPILFLTARSDEVDRIVGLELGADDYVTKPFSPRELVARVGAILKRISGNSGERAQLKRGDLSLNAAARRCRFGGRDIALTLTELNLLERLMRHPDHVVSRGQLADSLYGAGSPVSDRTIDSHLRNLRQKLADAGCHGAIETAHGIGVRMGPCAPGITRKWRPPLLLVIGGVLGVAMVTPVLALFLLRRWGEGPYTDLSSQRTVLVLAGTVGLVCMGYVLRRTVLKPVRELALHARAIRTGAPEALEGQHHYGTRELGLLAQAMIDMARTLHDRERTIRAHTDHVTHELKAPVSAIRGAAELLQDPACNGEELRALAVTIERAAGRMDGLLDAARAVAAAREPRHMGIGRVADCRPDLDAKTPELSIRVIGAEHPVPLAAAGLCVVLGHLAQNAAQHGASVLDIVVRPDAGHTYLSVSDNGSGIGTDNRDRVFEPFFSTRREHGGTGVGLAVTRNLLAAHGADIALEDRGSGACFVIRFQAPDHDAG